MFLQCAGCPIRHRAVCSRCEPDELEQLARIKTYRTYKAGEPIFRRGEPAAFVASVVQGVAFLSKTLEDGRIQVVGLLLPSDFIGRPGREELDFDVTATTDVTLCCFDRRPFERLLEVTPHVSQRLMEISLDELDAARDWMVLLGRKTAREKVATFIEMFLRRSTEGGRPMAGAVLDLHLTRDQIANYLGLTLETVSRQFNAFKKEGIIVFADRHNVRVADVAALHAATGDDAEENEYA